MPTVFSEQAATLALQAPASGGSAQLYDLVTPSKLSLTSQILFFGSAQFLSLGSFSWHTHWSQAIVAPTLLRVWVLQVEIEKLQLPAELNATLAARSKGKRGAI